MHQWLQWNTFVKTLGLLSAKDRKAVAEPGALESSVVQMILMGVFPTLNFCLRFSLLQGNDKETMKTLHVSQRRRPTPKIHLGEFSLETGLNTLEGLMIRYSWVR